MASTEFADNGNREASGRHMMRSTAFLHDFLLVRGGAEQFALHVHRVFPEMDCYCGFIDSGAFPAADNESAGFRPLAGPAHLVGWQGLKTMFAFRSRAGFLSEYETAIYSGVYCPVAVNHHLQGRDIYYCHTPPRFIYDLKEYYLSLATPWQKPLLRSLITYFQPRYEDAIRKMDTIIANSSNVRARLEKYVGIGGAQVIHPPVQTSRFSWIDQDDYFLSTARLEPYKRVDLVVQAFMQLPERKLVVASGGSQEKALRGLAAGHDNIRFAGWCSPPALRELVGRCLATIYIPRDEDFGISPIESMAAGKPVIGVAEGGLLESVLPNETGLLIESESSDAGASQSDRALIRAIVDAVQSLDGATALGMRTACEQRSNLFGEDVFDRKFRSVICQ